MSFGRAVLLATLLAASAQGWAQNATPASDAARLRASRAQLAALRAQLAAARKELSAQTAARQNLQAQLDALKGQQAELDALRQQLEALKGDVKALRANTVLDLNGYLTFDASQGYPTALFRGINVQIVNGTGETQTANGMGNLIVGYNRPSTGSFVCSVGTFESASDCQANGGLWAQSHKSGSHNIIGGDFNNYSSWGGIVLGMENTLSAPYAVVVGGARNRAAGSFASISGGSYNTATGLYSSVTAGFANSANGDFAAVAGGSQRSAPGTHNWAAGGLLQER